MTLRVAGMGWITPLGRSIEEVWNRLLRGDEARSESVSDRVSKKKYSAFLVPQDLLNDLPPHPRLRRASAISRFAAAAGLDALAAAKSMLGEIDMQRIGLVFAVSNGGVVYTKRFYHDIVASGAQSASPLLFPETVFNAPASHLAAILGITGVSYTLVGDGAVGLLAIKMAADLIDANAVDSCLVIAAEEADWLLCDAYQKWRLLKAKPPIEPFRNPPSGTILSEGAGAILLARKGLVQIDAIHAGANFALRKEASKIIAAIMSEVAEPDSTTIGSANGTFVDLAELAAGIGKGQSRAYSPKPALGESVGASALWQVIVAAQILRTQLIPPLLHPKQERAAPAPVAVQNAVVLSCGLNQQVAALRMSI
jgi:3-oxoacyl-(acyl-carrier-protein) synthase